MNKISVRQSVSDTIDKVYKNGLTSTSGGNISAIADDGTVFITPSGKDKGTLSVSDISEIRPDGAIVGGFKPSIELPFHKNVYAARPDVKGIVHAHAPAVVAFAIQNDVPDVAITPVHKKVVGNVGNSEYRIPGSIGLGDVIRDKFAEGYSAVMMANHGATTVGSDLTDAYNRYEALNDVCEIIVNAKKLGGANTVARQTDYSVDFAVAESMFSQSDMRVCAEIAAISERAFAMKLVSSYFGTIAYKTDDGAIIFNADGTSRQKLSEDSFVKYKDGFLSKPKSSSHLSLILETFARDAGIRCVFLAQPKAATAFAVSHTQIDTNLLPESYIALRNVARCAYGLSAKDCASRMSKEVPCLVIDNECAVTIGKNIIKAFDRMEVLDYSARSILMADDISRIKRISDVEIRRIDDTFSGW